MVTRRWSPLPLAGEFGRRPREGVLSRAVLALAIDCRPLQNHPVTPYAGKVFCIGFYKTGTTTLFEALTLLGLRTINGDTPGSYPGADDGATLIRQIDAGDFRLPTFDLFDAFTDNPYFHIWRE